jgi:hypothetical protein
MTIFREENCQTKMPTEQIFLACPIENNRIGLLLDFARVAE